MTLTLANTTPFYCIHTQKWLKKKNDLGLFWQPIRDILVYFCKGSIGLKIHILL